MDTNLSHHESSEEEYAHRLAHMARAGAGIIHVRTDELWRTVLATRKTVIAAMRSNYNEWDIMSGTKSMTVTEMYNIGDDTGGGEQLGDVLRDIIKIATDPDNVNNEVLTFYTIINPHFWWDSPIILQMLQQSLTLLPASSCRLVLVTPDMAHPAAIGDGVGTITMKAPSFTELQDLSNSLIDMAKSEVDLVGIDAEYLRDVCNAGMGMSRDAFELALSMGIADSKRDTETEKTVEALTQSVSMGKTEVLNQSELLELYPQESMVNVGGMENLKTWVAKRAGCYSDAAREHGVEPPKGCVVVGPPGCLSGNTTVDYLRGRRNSGRPILLSELYKKFNGIGTSTRNWDTTLPTFLHSKGPDGKMFYNRVVSVIESGIKLVTTVTLESGESLTLTHDHPIACPDGVFRNPSELEPGDSVVLRGSMKPVAGEGRRLDLRPPRKIVNLKHHRYGASKETDGYHYTRVAYARLVIEANMNDMPVDEFIHALQHNGRLSAMFKYLSPEYEVHHLDENTLNDEPWNLMVYTKEEHARLHGANENFNVEYFVEGVIASIADSGSMQTYDIQMEMPANNFVADGFLVHNTGKSLVAKAVSKELGVSLVRLDFGKVFNSLVGASEERIRKALADVASMAPCVLFVDEIDKGLGGIGQGGGDSGTSSRVLGSFLTWLNDNTSPVFTMVTANNIDALPPELMRRGRFDQIFSTGLPTTDERLDILNIHLSKRGWGDEFKAPVLQRIAKSMKGFVGAEVESVVKDALVDSFSEGSQLTEAYLIQAKDNVIPLSVAYSEQIQKMTLWAKTNAIPAGTSTEETTVTPIRSRRRKAEVQE